MHDPALFRQRLAKRLVGLVALAVPPLACASNPATGGASTGHGGGAGTSPTSSTASSSGIMGLSRDGGADAAADGAGLGGADTGDASSDASSDGNGSGGAGGASPNPPVTSCFAWPPDAGPDASFPDAGPTGASCPTDPTIALAEFLALQCPTGWEPYKIVSGPTTSAGECCYLVHDVLCGPGGRPYLVGDEARVAPVTRRAHGIGAWCGAELGDAATPSVDETELLGALAAAWAADGALEHASVASFARFALALMAVGAPLGLVERAHAAAMDEVRHAERCFALASRYARASARGALGPGAFPVANRVAIEPTLVALATSAAREGCVGETVAAVMASEQLARATDPEVRATLATIADDEARHAELAWHTVAWAIATGGEPVRAEVARALHEAIAAHASALATPSPANETTATMAAMEAHGRLRREHASEAGTMALATVVLPAARALLAA